MRISSLVSVKQRHQPISVFLALVMIGSGLVALPFSGQATTVGVLEAKWPAGQIFGLSDSFVAPSCDVEAETFAEVQIAAEDLELPFSPTTDAEVIFEEGWSVGLSYDEGNANPWSFNLYSADNEELRYSAALASWVTESDLAAETPNEENADSSDSVDRSSEALPFSDLPVFSTDAKILLAGREGLILQRNVDGVTKTILLTNAEGQESGLTFLLDSEFNSCVDGVTAGDNVAILSTYEVTSAQSFGAMPMMMSLQVEPENRILGNQYLRFGHFDKSRDDSQKNSITEKGNLSQPFYYNGDRRDWYKLTFSQYPLNMAFGSGTGGSNWTDATVADVDQLEPASQTIDWDGWVRTSADGAAEAYGHGVVIVDTVFTLTNQRINVQNKYSLGQTDSFVKIETTVTNLDDSPLLNFHIWTGTRDDFVAVTDGPLKYRGNLSASGEFELASSRTAQASALLVTSAPREQSDGDAVLFYSTTAGTNMIVDSCCGFDNVIGQDPSVGPSGEQTSPPYDLTRWDPNGYGDGVGYSFDGSYGLVLPMGDIPSDQSSTITWFYAGGSTGDLEEITSSVGSAAAPPAPTIVRTNNALTMSWLAPSVDAGVEIVGYEYRYSTDGGAIWSSALSADTDRSMVISPLDNETRYSFQVRAITAPTANLSTTSPGGWSGASTAEILGAPSQPSITTVRGGDSQAIVTYPAATVPTGINSPVLSYQYCLSNCSTDTSWRSLPNSPATVTSGLSNGQSYNMQIRALNENGASIPSQSVAFDTLPIWTAGNAAVTVVVDREDDVEDELQTSDHTATSGVRYTTTSDLPDWLSLNSSTGELEGEAEESGRFVVNLTATNSAGSITKRIVILVVPYVVLSPNPMALNLGSQVDQLIRIQDGSFRDLSAGATLTVANLPDGLTAVITNSSVANQLPSVRLVGTPTTLGSSTISFTYNINGDQVIVEIEVVVGAATASSGGGGGALIVPTPVATPAPSTPASPRPNPILGPPATSSPSPSPTPALGPINLLPEIAPTPGVVFGSTNPIPQLLVDLLSRPLAYVLEQLSGSPVLPELAPSESIAYENGSPVEIQLVKTDNENGYQLIGDGWQVALEATDTSGEPLRLDDSGNIILNQDRFVQFSGSGFAPGSIVKVWLFSDPTELSDVIADTSGNFLGQAQLPEAIPTGEHTVQLNGLTQDGQLRSVSLGVVVQPDLIVAPAAPVGFDLTGLMNFLWLLAAGVLLFFFIIWRKRKKEEEEVPSPVTDSSEDLIFASEAFEVQPTQQFPNDSRRKIGAAAPPNRKRFGFKPKGA